MAGPGKRYDCVQAVPAHSGADRLWARQLWIPGKVWCYHKLTKSVTAAGHLQEVSVHSVWVFVLLVNADMFYVLSGAGCWWMTMTECCLPIFLS